MSFVAAFIPLLVSFVFQMIIGILAGIIPGATSPLLSLFAGNWLSTGLFFLPFLLWFIFPFFLGIPFCIFIALIGSGLIAASLASSETGKGVGGLPPPPITYGLGYVLGGSLWVFALMLLVGRFYIDMAIALGAIGLVASRFVKRRGPAASAGRGVGKVRVRK
jgi:hypothetical protein